MPRGHFGKSLPELKMPKPEEWPVEAGFRAEGPVMSGKMSPELVRAMDAAMVARQQGPAARCVQPEFYDPVLRSHCGLGKAKY
jgi:hypothetical protein